MGSMQAHVTMWTIALTSAAQGLERPINASNVSRIRMVIVTMANPMVEAKEARKTRATAEESRAAKVARIIGGEGDPMRSQFQKGALVPRVWFRRAWLLTLQGCRNL